MKLSSTINFWASHIYKEGNFLADKLASLILMHPTQIEMIEWTTMPRQSPKLFHDNFLRFSLYHFT